MHKTNIHCAPPPLLSLKVFKKNFRNHELDRNLNRLEAKVTLLEQEKSRLTEDMNRQAQNIQDLMTNKKNLETELQDKKNLVINALE